MRISTRFSVGVHILALLHIARQKHITSDLIAGSVNTNPVVIRRLLSRLKQAGLVDVSPGVAGATLTRDPRDIRLLDVYDAVGAVAGSLFDTHKTPNPLCPVGAGIQTALEGSLAQAQAAMEQRLAATTLADIVEHIMGREEVSADMQDPARNKATAIRFWETLFNEHDPDGAAQLICDDYRQHNPRVPDLKSGFLAHFRRIFAEGNLPVYAVIHSAIAEGDRVVLHSWVGRRDAAPDDYGTAHMDIFRFQDGLIAEHWDVVQRVPAPAEFAHGNTMF